MVDKDTQDLVKATSSGVAEGTARAFLDTVFGFVVELGDMARDTVRYRRWRRQLKIAARAQAYLEEQGIPAGEVSLKTLVPLLELSSLEDPDDDDMVDRWAALLANAAGTERGTRVLPSFPRILGELSPEEALIS